MLTWSKKVTQTIKRKSALPNNNLFIVALFLFILFLIVEVGLRVYDAYRYVRMVDVPSHFFAGMAIGTLAYWFYALTETKHKRVMSVVVVFIISILWEIVEILQEKIILNPPYLVDVFFWDGFWDIIVAVAGGIVVFGVLGIIKKHTGFLNRIKLN